MTVLSLGCSDKSPPPPPPCEQECRDGVALRALRQAMKFAFNKTLQGLDTGYHDETTAFVRGSARVFGEVTTNAEQGTMKLTGLTYVFSQAVYFQKDDDPKANFAMGVDGTIKQDGTLAVQPSSPTALVMCSDAITLVGQIYDPLEDYATPDGPSRPPPSACPVELNQNGNSVAGWLCGRQAGFEF
jgi:hypothetical protein